MLFGSNARMKTRFSFLYCLSLRQLDNTNTGVVRCQAFLEKVFSTTFPHVIHTVFCRAVKSPAASSGASTPAHKRLSVPGRRSETVNGTTRTAAAPAEAAASATASTSTETAASAAAAVGIDPFPLINMRCHFRCENRRTD